MRKIVPYVPMDVFKNPQNSSCMISGSCKTLMKSVSKSFINSSHNSGKTVLILDYSSDDLINTTGLPAVYFNIDQFGYDSFYDTDIYSAVRFIKEQATKLGYPHEKTVQLVKYFDILEKINTALGLSFSSLRELNNHYYSIDAVNAEINKMLHRHLLNPADVEKVMNALCRSAGGNLLVDNILAELRFTLKTDDAESFSIKSLPQRTVCHLRMNSRYAEQTEALIDALTNDIKEVRQPINVVVNAAKSAKIYKLGDLINTAKINGISVLYIADDIFSETNVRDFFTKFDILCFGRHYGESAKAVSEFFGTRRVMEEHYTREYDRRLSRNSIIDILTKRNYTEGLQYVPAEIPCFRQDYVARLDDNTAICVFKNENITDVITV